MLNARKKIFSVIDTKGKYLLDNVYPYGVGKGSNDYPDIGPLGTLAKEAILDVSAQTWLMWQASEDTMPVPIAYWEWSIYGHAVYYENAGGWGISSTKINGIAKTPGQTEPLNSQPTNKYPIWNGVAKNKDVLITP